ncbi:fasciclin domain-containing protein [Robiginitalea sp.]|nr:fasciclin domain-containing protein [Robiginitalea sp.]
MKKNLLKWILPILFISVGISCSDDEDTPMEEQNPLGTIVETAAASSELTSLVAVLTAADQAEGIDLIGTLSGTGPFTVFAPTNAAFEDLLAQLDGYSSISDFDSPEDLALLASILTYHVVLGNAVFSKDLSNGQEITTVQGESLTISIQGGVTITDATGVPANVTTADIANSNGVVHLIDKVLIPQAVLDALAGGDPLSIVDLAVGSEILTNLVAALSQAGLVSALEGTGPFTVFAPTDTAFETFLSDNGFADLSEVPTEVLTQVLLNHVVSGKFLSTDLTSGYVSSLSTAGPAGANLSLYLDTSEGVVINGISEVILADIEANNGVVHVVNKVIGLPTIVDHALANPNLVNLVGALTTDGNTTFTDLLSGEGPFTVFAPLNTAFSEFTNPNGNELNTILANHVISGAAAFSSGLSTTYVNTLGTNTDGDNLSMYINTTDGVTLNGSSTVVLADVVAVNGVIHAVDAVIDVPTVVTFATADPNFSTLVTALTAATPATDFASVLSGVGPFTVFAPTNDAFQGLLDSNMAWNDLGDIGETLLTSVLNYHVVSGNIRSGDLTNPGNTTATTLLGQDLTITLPGSGNNIADITDGAGNTGIGIIAVDVQAGNGVIHVLNQVLLPGI